MAKCVCDKAEKWAKSTGAKKDHFSEAFNETKGDSHPNFKTTAPTYEGVSDGSAMGRKPAPVMKAADAKGGGGAEMGTTAPKPTSKKQMPRQETGAANVKESPELKPAYDRAQNTMKSEGAHGHCLGCNCVEKALPSLANFQSLASHPTAKPQPGAGAKPSAPAAVKVPGKGPADHVLDASHANKEIGSFQSLAKPVKKGLPGSHLFPNKGGM